MIKKKWVETFIIYRFVAFVLLGYLVSFTNLAESYSIGFVSLVGILVNAVSALLNGYLTSCLFAYAPTLVEDELKGKAGSSVSLFLISGIFSGTVYSLLLTNRLIS